MFVKDLLAIFPCGAVPERQQYSSPGVRAYIVACTVRVMRVRVRFKVRDRVRVKVRVRVGVRIRVRVRVRIVGLLYLHSCQGKTCSVSELHLVGPVLAHTNSAGEGQCPELSRLPNWCGANLC